MPEPDPFPGADLARFEAQGYLRLGHVLCAAELAALQQRIDDIMWGRVRYRNLRLQLLDETTGQLRRTVGHEVATAAYRRIDDLEQDPLFLAYIQAPPFERIARRLVGPEVSVFRSMFMNKPAGWTQELAWHQDVGSGWGIDRDPVMTVWTALDAATPASGCMQVVPGSHRHGVINARHFLSPEEQARYAPDADVIDLEAEPGEAILLHNYLLHRSGPNHTDRPRRAFSVTYMEAATRTRDTGQTFPVVFGPGALDPAQPGDKPAALIRTFYG